MTKVFCLPTGSRNWSEQKAKWDRLHHWRSAKPVTTRALPMPRVSEPILSLTYSLLVVAHVCVGESPLITREDKRDWVEPYVVGLQYQQTWSICSFYQDHELVQNSFSLLLFHTGFFILGGGNVDARRGCMCVSLHPLGFCSFQWNSGHISGQEMSDSAMIH